MAVNTNQAMGRLLLFTFAALLIVVFSASDSQAATDASIHEQLMKLTSESSAARRKAISALADTDDVRLVPFFEDYLKGNVSLYKENLVIREDTKDAQGQKQISLKDALTRDAIGDKVVASDLKDLDISNKERVLARDAIMRLRLSDPDIEARLQAIVRAGDSSNAALLPLLKARLAAEKDSRAQIGLKESIALLLLDSDAKDDEVQSAISDLGEVHSGRALAKLKDMQKKSPPAFKAGLDQAVDRIERYQFWAQGLGYVFSGLSLGSILVLMALGLSIIFGLMGVINMAHGELMMIGAYATFVTQKAFEYMIDQHWLSASSFNYYFVAAIPVSFLVAALAGYIIEITIIRFLYGRPLETLLATYGVSLVLTQLVRLQFGDNIAVNSPTWLQGGVEIMRDVVLPYNRCFIICFCMACIGGMHLIISKTNLGLLLRATTQNRNMAAALGVQTRRIDGYTFALGAGLAGLAGCALTQVGGITPDMGQNYIVDSFMVVVTGGVGKLAGAVWAGMALGCIDKLFEPLFQAVWAKVIILIFVVMFIQWRPSGLFPAKGRFADA